MIFVTVGTHEQPFDRLISKIDALKRDAVIQEEVFVQTGFSTYQPQFCEWKKLLSYEEMAQMLENARIIITHGGPASFISAIQIGKIPIVVPRRKEFGEHVNNHQVDFVKIVAERMGTIIPMDNVENLENVICNYETIVAAMPFGINSNSFLFNKRLGEIIDKLIKE